MQPSFIIVDLFCGAGGTTTGFAMSKVAKVIACVNHDPIAIKSHWANHPEVAHFEEDIRTLPLSGLKHIVKHQRKLHPNAKLILWASLECTNFSKAKGGQPRDADSRTLAEHLDRYIFAIRPDYIQIENVVEFMSWGPLDEKGKPLSRRSGSDWMHWRNRLCSYGYRDEWKELNSADFGAYTSRNRLFGCFAKEGLPIKWPQATHSKKPSTGTLYEQPLAPWMPVKDVLDLEDEGNSIFGRKKDLSENTHDRIYQGLIKFVAGGKDKFILKYNSVNQQGKHNAPSVDEPCPTIACQNRLGIAFLSKYYSGRPYDKNHSVDEPAGSITTADHHSLVKTEFLSAYYSNGDNVSSVQTACPTITTADRFAVVNAAHFINRDFSTGDNNSSIDKPSGAILATPKLNLVSCKYHYIVNPSWTGADTSVDNASPAPQDKAPYMHDASSGKPAIIIYENDSEMMVKIKEFMAIYGIIDIKMRMLKVEELKVIQGFPANYILQGNQSDQKKFIGNSVVPLVVKAWIEAMATANNKTNRIISQSKNSKQCLYPKI